MRVGASLAIGTATDPYQPAERRFKITQQMLQILAETGGLRLGITTKSDLVARDANLLRQVGRRHYLTVFVTITTLDAELARLLEPMAPRPDLRLEAVRRLSSAGVRVGVGCSPVLPLINDDEKSLDRLACSIAAAGAFQMHANVLFLKPSASQVFLPFLEEKFPHLVRRYRERFDRHAYLSGAYPEMIRERVSRIRARHFLRSPEARTAPEFWPHDPQMDLFEISV